MSNLNQVKESIKLQWEEMLNRGITPVIEYQTSEDDWLVVYINLVDKGLEFSFDSGNKPVSFDGDIKTILDDHYLLPFDEYFDRLDSYLEMISDNMTEGFLVPNELYYCED